MYWVRVDNRLVHGQVIESWLPYTGAKQVAVVNDELADDFLRQEIMKLAIPQDVEIVFVHVDEAGQRLSGQNKVKASETLVLLANCEDARRAYEHGMKVSVLNIANLHYRSGKEQICDHVALGANDRSCLVYFVEEGVSLDFRCLPNKPVQVRRIW